MTDPQADPAKQTVTLDQLADVVRRGLRRSPIPYEADSSDVLTLSACEKALDVICQLAQMGMVPPADPSRAERRRTERAAAKVKAADAERKRVARAAAKERRDAEAATKAG